MDAEERKLSTIMFTDMVGYTALVQSDEATALEVLKRHNRLLRSFFPKFKGREIKTIGDSFLVEFDSALDAAKCAIEIQEFLHDYNFSSREGWKINLRIGIHLGDVVHRDNDLFGDAVNIASRIEPLAEPEGVCISAQVYDQIHNKIGRPLVKLENTKLKNVQFATGVYAITMPWTQKTSDVPPIKKMDDRRIAILPFSNISPDPQDAYFADGMTEELISTVSKIRGLQVIARTSVLRYKDGSKGLDQIGRELQVGTILEGSVRKAGDKLRITTQLINSDDSRHLWSESYDRELKDVFAIQSDVARQVAHALKIQLLPQDSERIQKPPTTDIEAYTLYMKGLLQHTKFSKQGFIDAIQYFEQATEKDPQFALAFSMLADSYGFLGWFDMIPSSEAYVKAKQLAEKALALDGTLTDVRISLALVLSNFEWDSAAAEREIRRTIELNPNSARAHFIAAHLLNQDGRCEEAMVLAKKAAQLDPLSAFTQAMVGTELLYSRSYDDALEHLSRALELDANIEIARENIGLAYIRKGQYEKGLQIIKEVNEASKGTNPVEKCELANAYVQAGKIDKAREILAVLLQMRKEGKALAVTIAGVYSCLGEIDNAFEWLDEALKERDGYVRTVKIEFIFDNIRSDPRYPPLLQKLGLSTAK